MIFDMMDLYSAEEWNRLYKHIVIVYTQFNVSPLSFIYMHSILVDAVFFIPKMKECTPPPINCLIVLIPTYC